MKFFKKGSFIRVAALALSMTLASNASFAMLMTGAGYITVSADCTLAWKMISYTDDNGHGYFIFSVDGPCGHGGVIIHYIGAIPPGSGESYFSRNPSDYEWQYQDIAPLDEAAKQQILNGIVVQPG